ncbi:MAG: histidine kinase [Lachnospiraceae bacterium]|nr:histidine kinase [Lachnospiraceae bacterium]
MQKRALWYTSYMKKTNSSTKSLTVMIVITILVLISTEIINGLYQSRLNERALANYSESLSSSLAFWDNRLSVINNSLVQISDPDNEAYFFVAASEDHLVREVSKSRLYTQLNYYALSQQNDFHFYALFPSQNNLFIESQNILTDYAQRLALQQDIIDLTQRSGTESSGAWTLIQNSYGSYLVNFYYIHNNYIGAYLSVDTMAKDVQKSYSDPVVLRLAGQDGEILYEYGDAGMLSDEKPVVFYKEMSHLNNGIQICMPRSSFYNGRSSTLAAVILILLIGLSLLFLNTRYHIRHVLNPLENLKQGMRQFSTGNTEIRLDAGSVRNDEEISSLYSAFNDMVSQITSLKIQVYEQTLEKERIESDYQLTRVQPHFYANILNLILFLAQVGDLENIQKLAYAAGTYFRYLLGQKGTLVRLSDEVRCTNSYVEIQQIRYKDLLEYTYHSDLDEGRYIVLPMILQTFVGNSIKHNVTYVPLLHIRVEITSAEDKIRICIWDDGVGFSPEILEKLNNDIDISEDGHHIGIQNMKARIRMFYKDQGIVRIESKPGNTAVTIELPLLTEEKMQE